MLLVARTDTSLLSSVSLTPLLSLILFLLRRPWAVSSPHLRAKCGVLLTAIFLPVSSGTDNHSGIERWSNIPPVDGPHSMLLETHVEAIRYLAPALLLLYGDVEKTGFYEKLSNRRNIMLLLKYLWSLPSHRKAFRGIATNTTTGSADGPSSSSYFIRFANGLMNETNALVASTIELLTNIRASQLKMANPDEMAAMTDEEKNDFMDLHKQYEQECRFKAALCAQTLHMLTYLSSDEVIRQPFLTQEILPRFVSMLLNVLNRLVGSKSLELKVENMESYNFQPKAMLKDMCSALANFSSYPIFHERIVKDGFFEGILKIGLYLCLHLLY